MIEDQIDSLEVAAVFQSFPEKVRRHLLALRQMIFDLSSKNENIGQIEETLKWGVPSYLTHHPKSGTTIRLQWTPAKEQYGIYVHCQTSLIPDFKLEYPADLTYEKSRGIVFNESAEFPEEIIGIFLNRALTYHANK